MLTGCNFVGVTMYVVETLPTDFCVWLIKLLCSQPKDLALARRLRGERS
jgi:hypothetical protein